MRFTLFTAFFTVPLHLSEPVPGNDDHLTEGHHQPRCSRVPGRFERGPPSFPLRGVGGVRSSEEDLIGWVLHKDQVKGRIEVLSGLNMVFDSPLGHFCLKSTD